MNQEEMITLSDLLCSDESNCSNEVITDLGNILHGNVITDVTSPYYNAYLLPSIRYADFGGEHHGKHHPQLAATMFDFEKEPAS